MQENEELRKSCEILMQSHELQMQALRDQQARTKGTLVAASARHAVVQHV